MESVKKAVDNTKNLISQNKVVFGVIVVAVFSLGLYVFKNQEKFAVNLNLNGFSEKIQMPIIMDKRGRR